MNPNTGEGQPKFELPPPPTGYEAPHESSVEAIPSRESSPGKQPSGAQTSTDDPLASMPTLPTVTPAPVLQPTLTDDGATASSLPAADADRIEKEWVEKAKTIVSKTQSDPYEQKSEMSKVKAEYIKKRFKKTIPTDDTVVV